MPVSDHNNASPTTLGIASRSDRSPAAWRRMVLMALIVTAGCASNASTVGEERAKTPSNTSPSDTASIAQAPIDTTDQEPITPDPLATKDRKKDETTLLGERLGRLDALIRTASPDSARRLREEYQRLLSQFTGEEQQVQTGNPSTDVYNPARPNASPLPPVAPIDSFLSQREGGTRSIRRRNITAEELDRRLRADDPQQAPSSTPATTPKATNAVSRRKVSTPEEAPSRRIERTKSAITTRRTLQRREVRDEPTASQERSTSRAASAPNSGKRQFINGVAAAQAGDTKVAGEALSRSLESRDLPGRNRPRAEYSYGTSLEESGRPAEAATHYRKAAKSGMKLNHKAYIAQCRALARSGKRDEARAMLVDFIRRNPKSPQIISARKMLQTL